MQWALTPELKTQLYNTIAGEKLMLTNKDVEGALLASIVHWTRSAEGIDRVGFAKDCRLCNLFYKKLCAGCPIKGHTGRISCQATPYSKAVQFSNRVDFKATTPEAKAACLEEVEFLKMLHRKYFIEGVTIRD